MFPLAFDYSGLIVLISFLLSVSSSETDVTVSGISCVDEFNLGTVNLAAKIRIARIIRHTQDTIPLQKFCFSIQSVPFIIQVLHSQ